MTDTNLRPTVDEFGALATHEQAAVLRAATQDERRALLRELHPNHAADVLQQFNVAEQEELLALLEPGARAEARALLAYAEDAAGGVMNSRYLWVRPEMTVPEAITDIRKQATKASIASPYVYVLAHDQVLLGVLSQRELLQGGDDKLISDIMRTDLVTVNHTEDQEVVSNVFGAGQRRLKAVAVIDSAGKMKGVVTADEVVDVMRKEATEDIHKLGGSEALDLPYMTISQWLLIKKRGGWLSLLFLGELLTASAMMGFADEIAKAPILAVFLPLIISSGGNAGSQACTLVIRAMALGEVKMKDFFRVFSRECFCGLALGVILATLGLTRILGWQELFGSYGVHFLPLGLTVAFSLVGVVLWGSLAGGMLPFLLRRFGFDPATASAALVATLVDVTGLLIYFEVAKVILKGTLL